MIIDLAKFIQEERPFWTELENTLHRLEEDAMHQLTLDEARRFHYLYERASADLAKLMTFSSEPEILRYLESLVARAYGEIHETRERPHRLTPWRWFFTTFPQTFRRHINAFWLALAVTLVGCAFGGVAISLDSDAKATLLPFEHLQGDPSARVRAEEKQQSSQDRLQGSKTYFSSFLMTHNTKVSIFTLGLGISWGIGTIIMLFYNGIILGAVTMDYLWAGEMRFLVGWLLPHGAVEIPSILIAGQAGLVLGSALIGWGDRTALAERLRKVAPDLVTLIFGVAVMLVWAGLIESFLSQYHEPVIPYAVKIGFGYVELGLLISFLSRAGRGEKQ